MIHKFKIKRGDKTDLPLLDCGEPAIALDTEEFFIGCNDANIKLAKDIDLVSHIEDKTTHISNEDRNLWNSKASTTHNHNLSDVLMPAGYTMCIVSSTQPSDTSVIWVKP